MFHRNLSLEDVHSLIEIRFLVNQKKAVGGKYNTWTLV